MRWSGVDVSAWPAWSCSGLWSGFYASLRARLGWRAKALGVKPPSAECGLSSL
jgi:hypothetical protein